MNRIKFYQALSKFRAFADSVPNTLEIQPMNLQIYDELISDIEIEIGQDLAYFRIKPDHCKTVDEGSHDDWGRWQKKDTKLVCEQSVFLTHINGVIAYLNVLLEPEKPQTIGFIK